MFDIDQLRLEVLGNEIIVILPGASYGITYCKPTNSSHLVVKNFLSKIDAGAAMSQEEFLARAWKVANDKAHELGWMTNPEHNPV
jgi:hypothetical protein